MSIDENERQRAHFNSIAAQYHDARREDNHLLLKKLMWRLFFSRNEIRSTGPLRVLEPMCGFADGFDILSDHVQCDIEYEGYDYSDKVISILQQTRPKVRVWQADALTFCPDRNTYDVVILLGALHHVYRRVNDALAAIVPALKPGGWLINFEPTHGNPITSAIRSAIYKKSDFFDDETEHGFSTRELEELFKRQGLIHVDSIYPGLLSYILYYNPDAFPKLNLGGRQMVEATFALDKVFVGTRIGKIFSFATLSLWQRPSKGA